MYQTSRAAREVGQSLARRQHSTEQAWPAHAPLSRDPSAGGAPLPRKGGEPRGTSSGHWGRQLPGPDSQHNATTLVALYCIATCCWAHGMDLADTAPSAMAATPRTAEPQHAFLGVAQELLGAALPRPRPPITWAHRRLRCTQSPPPDRTEGRPLTRNMRTWPPVARTAVAVVAAPTSLPHTPHSSSNSSSLQGGCGTPPPSPLPSQRSSRGGLPCALPPQAEQCPTPRWPPPARTTWPATTILHLRPHQLACGPYQASASQAKQAGRITAAAAPPPPRQPHASSPPRYVLDHVQAANPRHACKSER